MAARTVSKAEAERVLGQLSASDDYRLRGRLSAPGG
jgi:hypothetical protein